MADETREGLTDEELEAQTGEALPDREAMSVVWTEPEPLPMQGGFGEHGLDGDGAVQKPAEEGPLGGGEEL